MKNLYQKTLDEMNYIGAYRVKTKPNLTAKIGLVLIADKERSFGGNSRTIYDDASKKFYWNSSMSYKFGNQGCDCFAVQATTEKFNVWAIVNNNWNGGKAKTGKWENVISNDLNSIYELFTDCKPNSWDFEPTVIFAKTSNGQYVFLGVYKAEPPIYDPLDVSGNNSIVIHKRISSVYPIKNRKISQ